MDRIFIEKLHIIGRHGVLNHERTYEQKFLVDISADFDTRKSSESDKLEDTLDYGKIRDIACDVFQTQSVYLIEKLAHTIAGRILAEENRITSITLTIRKPSIFPSGIPGVTIVRTRKDFSL